jgi:hypothetical protein
LLHRFAAATCVASPAVALATLIVLLAPELTPENVSPLLSLWCIVPALWGLWAVLAPRAWVPQRLPVWGAILGLLVGTVAMFVIDLPARMFGIAAPAPQRGLATLILAGLYSLLWLVVRAAFRALAGAPSRPARSGG